MGIEKVLPALARPRGLPPAAAALVDRRADEPVHVALDGRDARRRAAGVPPRAARQRPHRRAGRRGRARRRCAASAARRASTSAPSTSAPAATPTSRVYPGADRRDPDAAAARASRARRRCRAPRSLCGACYEVCPVKIDIPAMLVHLRGRVVREAGTPAPERAGDGRDGARLREPPRATRPRSALAGSGAARWPAPALRPGRASRELPEVPEQTFRDWWRDSRRRRQARAASGEDRWALNARDAILARVREALRDVPAGEPPSRRPTSPPARPATPSRGSPSAWPTTAPPCARPTPLAGDRRAGVRRARRTPAGRAGRACRTRGARSGSSSSRTTA